MATFVLLGLGAVYHSGFLAGASLISLLVGLHVANEAIQALNPAENVDDDEDPPLGIG